MLTAAASLKAVRAALREPRRTLTELGDGGRQGERSLTPAGAPGAPDGCYRLSKKSGDHELESVAFHVEQRCREGRLSTKDHRVVGQFVCRLTLRRPIATGSRLNPEQQLIEHVGGSSLLLQGFAQLERCCRMRCKVEIETRSERHAGAARPRTRGNILAAEAADQMDLRVGPTEIAVQAGDTRG